MKSMIFILVSAAVLLTIFSSISLAQIPKLISYQGKLNDANGLPVNGTRSITFTLYDAATGGTALWTEIHSSVTVTNGVFSVLLGSVTDLNNLAFDKPYYLGITVGSGTELLPRKQIVSVAYSMRAENANNAELLDGMNASSFLTHGHTIGEHYGGGIVFWVDSSGQHGLIASESDLDISGDYTHKWFNGSPYIGVLPCALGDGIGAGMMNTMLIMANHGNNAPAAKICAEYKVTENGITYGDWYLPSIFELGLLCNQHSKVGILNIRDRYWSSTETSNDPRDAWDMVPYPGARRYEANKAYEARVRAIRAF